MVCFKPIHALFHLTTGSVLTLSLGSGDGAAQTDNNAVPHPPQIVVEQRPHTTEDELPFLDAQDLARQEQFITSSLRQESKHRSLQANNCLEDKGGSLQCTSNDIKFLAITGVTVYDEGAYWDSDTGRWEGACRGSDDYVNLSFTANVEVSNTRYDVGLYVNTEGGSAKTGTCDVTLISKLDHTDPNVAPETFTNGQWTVTIDEIETVADSCPDITKTGSGGAGLLTDFAFAPLRLKCFDTGADSSGGDGLLDFNVAIAWDNAENDFDCSLDSEASWPVPGNGAKCWHEDTRFTVDVYVPPHLSPSAGPSISMIPSESPSVSSAPSDSPSVSSQPSDSPSVSSAPSQSPSISTQPSGQPSISTAPSDVPSDIPSSVPSSSPSVSTAPSDSPTSMPSSVPSESPSTSTAPSDYPTTVPSSTPSGIPSTVPSSMPSSQPSVSSKPSSTPSLSPSVSSAPSVSQHPSTSTAYPSDSPTESQMPSTAPTDIPSSSPSGLPSSIPSRSPSDIPSSLPSASPTDFPSRVPSASPSISQLPTLNTPEPTSSPSISSAPSGAPSSVPTISKMPSSSPSAAPSESPSESPTGSLYYPDWINENQVCVNDGADPEYMMQVQKDNYIYHSKQECCENHFWWRIQQCMGNQKPMYYKNGEVCDQKVFFEDWESKYTPSDWSSSDQFDTLRECCVAKFWYDVDGCMAASPKELKFSFTFTVDNMIEPTNCQDADIQAHALEVAINIGLGSSSLSRVSGIGCVELSRDPDTDNTICGGCISGSYLGDDYSNTRDGSYYLNSASATITVEASTKSSNCEDADCFSALYSAIIADFTAFVTSGDLTTEIVSWAQNRVPPVPELWNSEVDTSSFSTDGSYSDPYSESGGEISATSVTMTGELSVSNMPEITTSTELQEATSYYETAIRSSLESNGVLPEGATVTVTGFSNGAVEYEITMSAASSGSASQTASQINSSLSEPTTLAAITATVQTESSGGTLSMTNLSVDSNTEGTTETTTISKATSSGQLTTSVVTSSLSAAEVEEVETLFETSITETLQSAGVLPEGSYVTVTGITNGVVDYTITMFSAPSSDVGSLVSSIDSTLSDTSSLTAIAESVKTASSGSTVGTALASLTVSEFTAGATTGVPDTLWYPKFDEESSGCKNDGFETSYMKEAPTYYLFDSQKACCDQWFSYDPFCVSSSSSKKKFYPDLSIGQCGRKQLKDFESYERERYDTLEECCSAKFSSYNYEQCCSAPGLGGCTPTGVVKYLPNWYKSECFAKSETALAEHEKVTAYHAASDCCGELFGWKKAACCRAAGGC